MRNEDNIVIDHIINSLNNFALRDIKKVGVENNLLASFMLCSCFIDQLSGFRYNQDAVKSRYQKFVEKYLPNYIPVKLYEDLRNKLVHNYSLGDSYSLVRLSPHYHLKFLGKRQVINVENFIDELEQAFIKYCSDLKTDIQVKQNALEWFKKHQILGKDNIDFFSFQEAEIVVKNHRDKINGLSKLPSWPMYLRTLLIVPSGCDLETLFSIFKHCLENKCNNKQALVNLLFIEQPYFDVFIVGSDKEYDDEPGIQVSFLRLSDYLSSIGHLL